MKFIKLPVKMFITKCFLIILLSKSVQLESNDTFLPTSLDIRRNSPGTISFHKFNRYDEIVSYMKKLEKKFPRLVQVINIGKTYENRSIYAVRISTNLKQRQRPAIFLEAGIHAREWASPATATYLLHNLVEHDKYVNMIREVDWFIIPVLNPDGYEYSHTKNRLWRKNRSVHSKCIGVDLNRNFDFHWMDHDSSSDECSGIYAGPYAFSEKETKALRNIVSYFKDQIKLYISLHAFGPMILYPWSYTNKIVPDNVKDHAELAENVANAIKHVKGGSIYRYGASTDIYDTISGVSDDWAKGVMGIPLILTIELPPGGTTGFELPPENIIPVARETFQGFKEMFKFVSMKWNRARGKHINKNIHARNAKKFIIF